MSDGDYRCHRTRNIGLYLKWNEGEAVRMLHKRITVLSANSRGMKMLGQHNAKNKIYNHTHFTYIYNFSDMFHILIFFLLMYPAEHV
jgi:hypothetical protein